MAPKTNKPKKLLQAGKALKSRFSNILSFEEEFSKLLELVSWLKPSRGEIPSVPGIDIYGVEMPYNGKMGGDHITYIDFSKRFDLDRRIREAEQEGKMNVAENLKALREKGGVLLIDVAGHSMTDAFISSQIHQLFLLGADYELLNHGQITPQLLERINTRLYLSSNIKTYATVMYGEISRDGTFRYISAAHPSPLVFSHEKNSFVPLPEERTQGSYPLGLFPSESHIDVSRHHSVTGYYAKPFHVNELKLMGEGDILIMYTDGLYDLKKKKQPRFIKKHLESLLAESRNLPAKDIAEKIRDTIRSDYALKDDTSYVVIKRELKKPGKRWRGANSGHSTPEQ